MAIQQTELHLHKRLVSLLQTCLHTDSWCFLNFVWEEKWKKKIDTISLHNPAGYKERVGVGGSGVWRDCRGEQVKEKSSREELCLAPFLAFAAPPIPASPRLGGLNNCSWRGGKCSLCSLSVPVGVLPTCATLAISCRLTLSDFDTHTPTHKRVNTQALCRIWT